MAFGKSVFSVLIGVLIFTSCMNKNKTQVTFKILSKPFSADPYDYDFFVHHRVYRSVLSTLVSNYSSRGVTGVLVDSWSNSTDFKEWRLKLKTDQQFSNGDTITPGIILKSLKRIIWLLKVKDSQEKFLDLLEGVDDFTKLSDELKGLYLEGNTLVFKFQKPIEHFLTNLSFGLYSIVHPKNYEPESGAWISGINAISSGGYKIERYSESKKEIILRTNPHFKHPSNTDRIEEIRITWHPEIVEADIKEGTSVDLSINKNQLFHGGARSNIAFIRCHSWDKEGSVCYNSKERKQLRDQFYKHLEKSNIKYSKTFFPMSKFIPKQGPSSNFGIQTRKSKTTVFGSSELNFYKPVNDFWSKIGTQVKDRKLLFDVVKDFTREKKQYSLDFVPMVTGILVDSPKEDINFMFKSKMGINLPDTTGEINRYIEKQNYSIDHIEKLLHEQAVIWPVAHFSIGLYHSENIDFSKSNMIQPPIDFNWVGIK